MYAHVQERKGLREWVDGGVLLFISFYFKDAFRGEVKGWREMERMFGEMERMLGRGEGEGREGE